MRDLEPLFLKCLKLFEELGHIENTSGTTVDHVSRRFVSQLSSNWQSLRLGTGTKQKRHSHQTDARGLQYARRYEVSTAVSQHCTSGHMNGSGELTKVVCLGEQ
jgi:hypothetical protein